MLYPHLRWTWGCANVLIRRGVYVTGIGQLIILLSPPVLDVSSKRIHLTWPVSTCQDNQKWVLETAAAASEERIWGVEDVINLLSPAANTKWIPYKQQSCICIVQIIFSVLENCSYIRVFSGKKKIQSQHLHRPRITVIRLKNYCITRYFRLWGKGPKVNYQR